MDLLLRDEYSLGLGFKVPPSGGEQFWQVLNGVTNVMMLAKEEFDFLVIPVQLQDKGLEDERLQLERTSTTVFWDWCGWFSCWCWQVIIRSIRGRVHVRNTLQQLELVGPRSLGVSLLTASFVGMVFTIQAGTIPTSLLWLLCLLLCCSRLMIIVDKSLQ